MPPQSTVNVECQFIEEFVDEMIPARGALVAAASPSTPIRDIWIEVIRGNATPAADGQRLKVKPGCKGGTGRAIVFFSLPGCPQPLNRTEGDELDVSSEHYLLLHRRGEDQTAATETTTYVLWRDIQYVEFARRAK